MERIENKPEGKLMMAIFGKDLNLYPYIVVEEDEKKRKIWLGEAIQDALKTLPLNKGKNDSQGWLRLKKVLELRFGLVDGKARTLREIGQEFGITGEAVRQIEAKAIRILRHPSRSRKLRRFIILLPEEISHLLKEITRLRDENRFLSEDNQRLLEGVKPEDLAPTDQTLKEDQEALKALISRFPNNPVWNPVRRAGIFRLSELKEVAKNQKIRRIGKRGQEFLEEILQTVEQEASP